MQVLEKLTIVHNMPDFGFQVEESRDIRSWSFGGLTGLPTEVIQMNRQWRPFVPVYEPQRGSDFDTSGCVTWSALNCLETVHKRIYAQEVNFSDRYTAVLSGTKPGFGNYFGKVAESIERLHGLVKQESCPFPPTMKLEEFFSPISQPLQQEGNNFFTEYQVHSEYVSDDPETLWEVLQYGPIQVAFCAYGIEIQGIFQRTEGPGNHAVMLYGGVYGETWDIYDHYDRKFKTLAWNSKFHGAMRYNILKKEPITMPTFQFKEGFRYFVSGGAGRTVFFFAGKLRQDDLAKCNDQWFGRMPHPDFTKFRETITEKQLEGVKIYNLKGDLV